jgi:hypothetical protein
MPVLFQGLFGFSAHWLSPFAIQPVGQLLKSREARAQSGIGSIGLAPHHGTPRQHNQGNQTSYGHQVARSGIQGGYAEAGNRLVDHRIFEQTGLRHNPTGGIDETTDTGIGTAYQAASILDGPENGHGKMLVGRTASIEPGIVGQIDQQAGVIVDQ